MSLPRGEGMVRLRDPIGWLRNMLRRWGMEWFARRYYGVYPGSVVANDDPEERGRVRLLCPAIGLLKAEDIPKTWWAMPCLPGLGTDAEGQLTGVFHPPDVGTNVWVAFQFGDPAYPVYMGGFPTTATGSDTFRTGGEAWRKGIRTRTGHYLRFSDDGEDLHVVIGRGDGAGNPSPAFIALTKEGHVQVSNGSGSMIYLNAEKAETSIMTANAQQEVASMLVLGDDEITLATKSGGSVTIKGKDVLANGDNVVMAAAKQFWVQAGGIRLGRNASQPAVRGLKFVQWALIHQHAISTPTPGSPTVVGPTPPPLMGQELSDVVMVE